MNIDKILEYQKIDQELISLENDVVKSKERQNLAVAKSRLDAATETIGKLNVEAADLLAVYASMRNKIDALKAELDEFDGILDDVQDATEADHYLKMVANIADKINSLEKEANSTSEKIKQVNDNYKKTWEAGVKANELCKAAKVEYDAFVKKLQPQVAQIKAQLNALKADIPEKIMTAYVSLRTAKKMPAFVPYDGEHEICSRCRMEIDNNTKSKLRNVGDVAECPNCRRILFVEEKK